nr:MAG TPA: hypothetical protein [Caudoviricetes sp.]
MIRASETSSKNRLSLITPGGNLYECLCFC